MTEYEFTLTFAVPSGNHAETLYRYCNDALIGEGEEGKIALWFIREASSYQKAVSSAIADVQNAIPEATFNGVVHEQENQDLNR